MENNSKKKQFTDEDNTIDIKNYVLRERLDKYLEKQDASSFNDLMNCITASRILLPANLNEKNEPTPCLISRKEGERFLAIYTNKEHIPPHAKYQAIVNIPYVAINHMAADPKTSVVGIVINPFTNNLIFKPELLKKVEEVEKAKQEKPKQKVMKLTPEQYVKFERHQFEAYFLPGKLYAGGQDFVDALCEKREMYIDELYEESYKEKRMYPYLEEDFSVMPMNITQDQLIIRVDMPQKDIIQGLCYRVYIAWNRKTRKGGYFMIEAGKGPDLFELGEITPDKKQIEHGEAPVEGAELQTIIDLLNGEVTS